jgi:GNAT superfamily N-acetyltransferase
VENRDGAVLVAEEHGSIVGFLYLHEAHEADPINLVVPGMATMDPLGAFVQRGSRRSGIGTSLVTAAFDWCRQRGISEIHVDWESANPTANQFWPRHFRPTLYSVKRRLNADAPGRT